MGNSLEYMGYCPSQNFNSCILKTSFWIDQTNLLPPLGGDADTVTASGLSSGAFMSTQLHVAFSDVIKGIGFVEGGSYYSAAAFALEDDELSPEFIS